MAIPTPSVLDIATDNQQTATKEVLTAKYADTMAYATYATTMLEADIVNLTASLGSDTVDADIAAITAEIGSYLELTPGTITAGTTVFSESLLTGLQAKLSADLAGNNTGLGDAEAALFARETARQSSARLISYNEITTQFSARGFDVPPGALLAKQTEANNESAIRLSDSSSQIMAESARLAVDYNKAVMSNAAIILDLLSRLFDSQQMRAFEASKATVMLAVESYKSTLGLMTAKADVILKKGDMVLNAKARQLALEVQTLLGLAQGATQMVAAALNGTSVSTSFGFTGSVSSSYDINNNTTDSYGEGDHPNPTLPRL